MHFTFPITINTNMPNTFCETIDGIWWEKNDIVIQKIIDIYNYRVAEIGIIKWYGILRLCGLKKEHHTKEKSCFFHIYIFLI